MLSVVFAMLAAPTGAVPTSMKAVVAAGGRGCNAPDWSCLSVETVGTPAAPKSSEVLIQIKASSVNPYNIDGVQGPHVKGVIGGDASGVVVSTGNGADCSHLSVGAEVWAQHTGTYAEYAISPCKAVGLKPASLSFVDAGTMPCVGVTSLQCLQATGAPWKGRTNVTVVITSGQGGTGFIGIQLAKALSASHVVTAASGDGIAFVKSLGADLVIDYAEHELFSALPDDSVDIVYDNYGAKGTADRAMPKIRTGGVYLVMDTGGGGQISKHPKPGVKQIAFGLEDPNNHATGLDILKGFFDEGKLTPHTQANYTLDQIKDAFNVDLSGKVMGKLAITP